MASQKIYPENKLPQRSPETELSSPFFDEVFADAQLQSLENQNTSTELFQVESPFLNVFEKDVQDVFGKSETEECEGYLDDEEIDEELREEESVLENSLEDDREFGEEIDSENAMNEDFLYENVTVALEESEKGFYDDNDVDNLEEETFHDDEEDNVTGDWQETEALALVEAERAEEYEESGEFEENEITVDLYDSNIANAESEYSDETVHESHFDEYEIAFEAEEDESDLDDVEDEYVKVDNEDDYLTNDFEDEEYQRGFYESWELETEIETDQTLNSLIHNIVATAKAEYKNWNYGRLKETESIARPYLEKYWKIGGGRSAATTASKIRGTKPWSAVFISYVIYKAGGVPPFRKSAGHHIYAKQAKKNRASKKLEKPISMWLFNIHEVKPQVGDLLFNARVDKKDRSRNGANFDNVGNGNDWALHSDIVIGVNDLNINVIGGNVGANSKKKKGLTVNIREVTLDSDGYVELKGVKAYEYFGILRFFSPNQPPRVQAKKSNNTSILSLFREIGLGAYDFGRMSLKLFSAISSGQDENKLTDLVFHYKYPSKKGLKLKKNDPLIKEWVRIRNLFIRPLLRTHSGTHKTSFGDQRSTVLKSSRSIANVDAPSTTSNIRQIRKYRSYFTIHPKRGSLTKVREGMHSQPKVPSTNSGITLAVGIDLTAFAHASARRVKFAHQIKASKELKAWILSVPRLRGEAARKWLRRNPMPGSGLSNRQFDQIYEFGRNIFQSWVRARLLGKGRQGANLSSKLNEAQYNDLALDPASRKDDFLLELLVDLMWNSAQFANGKQNKIAQALTADNVTGDRYEKQISQLGNLRGFIEKGKFGGAGGRWKRMGWIDSKIAQLRFDRANR